MLPKTVWPFIFKIALVLVICGTVIAVVYGPYGLERAAMSIQNYIFHYFKDPITKDDLKAVLQNNDRFIAQAGGKIGRHTYTNSLEALNLNYERGFRLFEIDLRLTRDEKLVAVHEWIKWKRETGYQGEIPPTYKEFMERKVKNKYTPMDSDDLVRWFQDHPDAVLVTDKINDPALIARLFPFFKSRLIMELFSWEAVKEANRVGIFSIMLTGRLILKERDYIKKLQRHGVTLIGMSRQKLPKDLDIMVNLKKHGYKVYLFHINSDGYNQQAVICHFIDYVHGLYADSYGELDMDCSS